MRCLSCKYELRNLSEHRCPECGREFDPNDPSTYETDASQQAKAWKITWGLIIGIYIVAFIGCAIWLSQYGVDGNHLALTACILVIMSSPFIVFVHLRMSKNRS